MKVYFLRFEASDLTQENGLWVTNTIDIYDNNQFKNYSTYKTSYGLGGELFTWAGLKRNSAPAAMDFRYFTLEDLRNQSTWTDFDTDAALVRSGRVIDLTARVDLVSFTVDSSNRSAKLYVYADPDSNATNYASEWFRYGGVRTNELLDVLDVDRYVKFAFELESDPTALATPVFEALVRVEIHDPVVSPLHRFTRSVVANFPQWMAMHSVPEDSATPAVSEPETVGAQFINALIGEGLDESYRKLYRYRDQTNIYTVDLEQIYQAYRTSNIPARIYSISADGLEPAVAGSYSEFLKSPNSDTIFIDYDEDVLYSIKEYTTLTINGEVYSQSRFAVFNFLDDLGARVDLYRIDGENNENFQKRILDVYQNRPGSGLEQFKLALRRELDLWRTEGATPSSDYVGATPTVLEMEDILNDDDFFDSAGLPKKRFVELIDNLSRRFPATWGRFVWGEALWDVAGEGGVGYGVLPYQYDATPVPNQYRQPGVGDGDDLLLHRPDADTGPEDYTATLRVRGQQKTLVDEYSAIELNMYSQPIGSYNVYSNPTTTIYLTIEVTTNDATPSVQYAVIQMSATSDVNAETPSTTSQSWAYAEVVSEIEDTTDEGLIFRDKDTDIPYGSDFATPLDYAVIPFSNITSIEVKQGRWDGATYQDVLGSDHYKVWFEHAPGTALEQPTGTLLTLASPNLENERPELVMESKQVGTPVATEWRGDRVDYDIELNGVPPYLAAVPKTVPLEGVFFNSYVTGRQIEVGFESFDGVNIGTTKNDQNQEIPIPPSLIFIDGSNTYTNFAQTFADTTTSVTLTTGTDLTYPVENSTWATFEANQATPFSGIADVNGPWINGVAPRDGNTNLVATIYDSLERGDFGVPNTNDYVLHRMEVSSNNERVVVHLDSPYIQSATPVDSITSSAPSGAILEKYDDNAGVFYFEPFTLKARAKRGPTKDWKPQINTGFFYTRNNDYYLFAKPETLTTSGVELELTELARQGAPIVVKDGTVDMRQVSFFDEQTLALTFTNTETIVGDGSPNLVASFEKLYDIAVVDEAGNAVALTSTTTNSNIITLSGVTLDGHEYEVSYKLQNSFYVDHDFLNSNNIPKTKVFFDQAPTVEYSVTYETSDLKQTSFADVALNPAYSSQTEGFIFISDNEYQYAGIDFYMSPSSLLADGESFAVLTFYAYDEFGNPKSEQGIDVSTTYGNFGGATPSQSTTVTTNIDGFAYTVLHSEELQATPVDPVPATGQITYTPVP